MKALALFGLLGAFATLIVWLGSADASGGEGRSESSAPPVGHAALVAACDREHAIEASRPALAPAPPVDAELLASLAALRATVDALDARVDALTAELAARPAILAGAAGSAAASYAGALARSPETQWSALAFLREDFRNDAAAALRAVRFLTPHELLERYGAPSSVRRDGDDGGVRWIYRDADRGLNLRFSLLGDYVTGLNVAG